MKKQPIKDRVPDGQWVSQQDAAKQLGVSLSKVGVLIANGHLDGAGNASDDMGVTAASLRGEIAWRQTANFAARVRRLLGDTLNWL